jgi:biopolymer transport protein ExbD
MLRQDARLHRNAIATINITPLVDVMLTVLVIFMLAAPMTLGRIELHRSGGDSLDERAPPENEVLIQADGSVRWDGVELRGAGVYAQLAHVARATRQPMLRIEGAPGLTYEPMARFLADAQHAGVTNLQLSGF